MIYNFMMTWKRCWTLKIFQLWFCRLDLRPSSFRSVGLTSCRLRCSMIRSKLLATDWYTAARTTFDHERQKTDSKVWRQQQRKTCDLYLDVWRRRKFPANDMVLFLPQPMEWVQWTNLVSYVQHSVGQWTNLGPTSNITEPETRHCSISNESISRK